MRLDTHAAAIRVRGGSLLQCKLCGHAVESPCSSYGQLSRCKPLQENRATSGVCADVVRQVQTCGGKTYVPVTDLEVGRILGGKQ